MKTKERKEKERSYNFFLRKTFENVINKHEKKTLFLIVHKCNFVILMRTFYNSQTLSPQCVCMYV